MLLCTLSTLALVSSRNVFPIKNQYKFGSASSLWTLSRVHPIHTLTRQNNGIWLSSSQMLPKCIPSKSGSRVTLGWLRGPQMWSSWLQAPIPWLFTTSSINQRYNHCIPLYPILTMINHFILVILVGRYQPLPSHPYQPSLTFICAGIATARLPRRFRPVSAKCSRVSNHLRWPTDTHGDYAARLCNTMMLTTYSKGYS